MAASWSNDIYHSLPLPSPLSIRLLRLCSPDGGDIVRCSLEVVELSSKPDYAALSYTWGPPTYQAMRSGMTNRRSHPIFCNDQEILVTENLSQFLRAYRSLDDRFWIDAICINQDNDAERNQQLLLMTDIYTRASQTVIWLGEQDESTEPAIQLLNLLASMDPRELQYTDPLRECFYQLELGGKIIDSSDWIALARLLQRSWFSRIWILQEIVVAERCAVMCGHWLIVYKALLRVSCYFADTKSEWMYILEDKDAKTAGVAMPSPGLCLSLVEELRAQLRRDLGDRLTQVIKASWAFHSSDPRDKIYALLGLCQRPYQDQGNYSSILPDYTKSISDIYIEATVVLMRESEGLTNLSRCQDVVYKDRRENRPDLPSWVPDYSDKYMLGIGIRQAKLYSASKDLEPLCPFRTHGRILALSASKFDMVTRLGPQMDTVRAT